MNTEKKLKPVIFVEGDNNFYRKNEFAQNLLLKAVSKGVTDPKELRKIAGLRSVADVYRTLDKMAIRKEYHQALSRAGMTLDYVVGEIKNIIQKTDSEPTKLKALQTVLKSIGLEKYDKQEEAGKTWEESILKAVEAEKKEKDALAIETKENDDGDYEVDAPDVPDNAKKTIEEEKKLADELYGE